MPSGRLIPGAPLTNQQAQPLTQVPALIPRLIAGHGLPASPTGSIQFNQGGVFGGSANFTYNGTSISIIDPAYAGSNPPPVAHNFITANLATSITVPATINEAGIEVDVHIPLDASTLAGNKAAINVFTVTDDGNAAISRTALGVQAYTIGHTGNLQAAIWGGLFGFIMQPGADGRGTSMELDMWNLAVDQPVVFQSNSKYGLILGAGSPANGYLPVTAGILLGVGNTDMHMGIYTKPTCYSHVTDNVLIIDEPISGIPNFTLQANGNITSKGTVVINSPNQSGTPASQLLVTNNTPVNSFVGIAAVGTAGNAASANLRLVSYGANAVAQLYAAPGANAGFRLGADNGSGVDTNQWLIASSPLAGPAQGAFAITDSVSAVTVISVAPVTDITTFGKAIVLPEVTFANLPAAPLTGTTIGISDSNQATFGGTITAGLGANHGIAYFTNGAWTFR